MLPGASVPDSARGEGRPPAEAVAGGIVLTGTRGAGKSTVARELDAAGTGANVRSVTTRGPRGDDAGHYDYLTATAFDEEAEAGRFLVVARYGEHSYAVYVQEVLRGSAAGVPPILTLTPSAAATFLGSEARLAWRGVYLDAPDGVLDARLAARGIAADPGTLAQRVVDRSGGAEILPVVMNDRSLEEAVAAVVAAVGFPEVGT